VETLEFMDMEMLQEVQVVLMEMVVDVHHNTQHPKDLVVVDL